MYELEDIKNVHLELTSKCQARCPMCPRRINGGPINPLITETEIDLKTFKEWFPITFLKQLDSLFLCGNLGDPIIAQDCLTILQYIKETNPTIKLSMHTNGSARSLQWWEQLAYTKTRVVFGIDGLKDTHLLYRIGTSFDKVIENATAFIQAGGEAEWHMLAFQHNENQIDACQLMASRMNFKNFQVKHTTRFINEKFNVLDDLGRTTHILYPTEKSKVLSNQVSSKFTCQVDCKAQKYKQIYVSADGNVSPCCWLDLSWQLPRQENRIEYMDKIGEFPNLCDQNLQEIFESNFFNKIETAWKTGLQECSKQCGKFDKLGAQFENRS